MSKAKGDKTENERFLDALVEELCSMNDTDVLEGEDPAELVRTGEQLLQVAKAEVGRRRRDRAKQQLLLVSGQGAAAVDPVTATQARAYLRERSASGQLTLAARGLDEMSDSGVLTLYKQLRTLDHESGKTDKEPGE